MSRYRRLLASAYINIGVRAWSGGDNRAAAASYSRALPILERLVADEPGKAETRKILAVCCRNLNVVLGPDRREEKERFGKQALALCESLANEFPQVPVYRDDLAASYDRRGIDLAIGGRAEDAERGWHKAADLWEELAKRFPEVPGYRSRLGGVYHNLATGLTGRGALGEARRLLEQAIAHQQFALRTNPKNPTWRLFLGNHYEQQAEVLMRLGDYEGAARSAGELADLFPDRWDSALRAAKALIGFMPPLDREAVHPSRRNDAAMRGLTDKASGLLREAARRGTGDANAQNAVARLLATSPDTRFGDPTLAVKLARAAVELKPSEAAFWSTLGTAEYRGELEGFRRGDRCVHGADLRRRRSRLAQPGHGPLATG